MPQSTLQFANGGAPLQNNGQRPGVQYSGAVNPATNGAYNAGRQGFGYLDNGQVGTEQWGRGESFQGAGRQAVIGALQGGITDSNPLDTAGTDEARQYLRDQLGGLGDLQSGQNSALDTTMQRGLRNMLSQQRAGAAGTGSLGSRQFGGQSGDITAKMGSDYMNGLIQNRADSINRGLSISQGLQGIQQGDLGQRAFQLQEQQALANGYMGLMGMDAGREAQLEGERFSSQQQDKQMLNNDIMGIVQGGAMLAGGAPPGAAGAKGASGASVAPSNVYADTYGTPMAAPAQSYWGDQYNQPLGYNAGMNPGSSGYGYGG
jgi:hypothetical protein